MKCHRCHEHEAKLCTTCLDAVLAIYEENQTELRQQQDELAVLANLAKEFLSFQEWFWKEGHTKTHFNLQQHQLNIIARKARTALADLKAT
jgi:hypothetical protein